LGGTWPAPKSLSLPGGGGHPRDLRPERQHPWHGCPPCWGRPGGPHPGPVLTLRGVPAVLS